MALKLLLLVSALFAVAYAADNYAKDASVKLFQKYIRINTTSNGDLTPAVKFWTQLAEDAGVTICKHEYKAGYPVLVMRWPGKDSSLPSIMLNSHMDVVPADPARWKYPPFNATLDENNDIYGRGTQDMKSVGMQYYLALKKLKNDGVKLLRDVYTTYMPDEEIGGLNGMVPFLKSEEFALMNVGVEMDEGAPWPQDLYPLFYQDKATWQFVVTCRGAAVHSATFPASNLTAVGKCRNVIDKFMDYRDQQHKLAAGNTILNAGPFTNVNINRIHAGAAAFNIIPSVANLTFDVRPAVNLNLTAFQIQIQKWLTEAGTNISISYVLKDRQAAATVHNSSNPYYEAILAAAKTRKMKLYPMVAPGGTDGRYVRLHNIPSFGFSPMINTTILAHADNEYLNARTFLHGIGIYYDIIQHLADIPAAKTKGLKGRSLVIPGIE